MTPFLGEIMTCSKCGWQFQSNWQIESMWTAIAIDDQKMIYVCPHCWGIPTVHWPKEVLDAWNKDRKNKKV